MFVSARDPQAFGAPRRLTSPRAPPSSAPGAMARARVFSVLVPDGVQGVPLPDGVSPKDPETSGPPWMGKILKHQDNTLPDILRFNPFYPLSVPPPQRAPKSIIKHGVFHAKNFDNWADAVDDATILSVSGFQSTKLSQFLPSVSHRHVSFCVPKHYQPSTAHAGGLADSFTGRLFKACFHANDSWDDADVEAEVKRVTCNKMSVSDFQTPELPVDQREFCKADVRPGKHLPVSTAPPTASPRVSIEDKFPAQCAGFEAIGLPWVMLKAGHRNTKTRYASTRFAPSSPGHRTHACRKADAAVHANEVPSESQRLTMKDVRKEKNGSATSQCSFVCSRCVGRTTPSAVLCRKNGFDVCMKSSTLQRI